MTDSPPTLPVKLQALQSWMDRLLVQNGMFAAEAEIVSQRLIQAELLGRPAGGLRWLPRLLDAMDVGDIDPRAQILTLTDLPALLVIDGSTGVGQVVITRALELAVKKARIVGSAVVVVKNSRPLGDPAACLFPATSAGCVAGLMTTCQSETAPWPIGPCTVWAWPGTDSPLITASNAPLMSDDHFADVIATGLGGLKPSVQKKRLFADDAEHVCFITDLSKCTDREQFDKVAGQTAATNVLKAPAWMFDAAKWPETADISATIVAELKDLASSSRVGAEW